ncbi:MAG TPA: hypothetical protein VGR64_07900 [Terracidiphilus sp.]|nr:hypothetical protein [Terracidiphilus sp.]
MRLRGALAMGLAALTLAVPVFARMQEAGTEGFGGAWDHKKQKSKAEQEAQKQREWMQPSEPAQLSIPVEPLGFSAPSDFYQGLRERLVSLDFLDENRLLFSFRAPGLIHRKAGAGGDERQIRALVLTLPQGGVEAQAVWTLHDTDRYLWMLRDGHFLLRDRNNLARGNASLELKPFLTFPGPLADVEMDPEERYLVTDSLEPKKRAARPGEVGSPATAEAKVTTDGQVGGTGGAADGSASVDEPPIVLRILERATGRVMLVSRVRMKVHLPINDEGYIEVLQGTGWDWVLNLDFFSGGSRIVGKVSSHCRPTVEFVAPAEVLTTTCDEDGTLRLVVMATSGKEMWETATPETEVWPIVVKGASGTRIARETLAVTHPVGPYSPLSFDDVKGQLVRVYDAASGKVLLEAPATPVLDGGGNMAISPSGRRAAVLDGGAIRVYELDGNETQAGPEGARKRR